MSQYVMFTRPRESSVRFLKPGDEVATLPTVWGPALVTAPQTLGLEADQITWCRVQDVELLTPDYIKAWRSIYKEADALGCHLVLAEVTDENGERVEGPARAFHVNGIHPVMVRMPVEVEELAFIEYLIGNLNVDKVDTEALRALEDASDEEGQRVSVGVTSASGEYVEAVVPFRKAIEA